MIPTTLLLLFFASSLLLGLAPGPDNLYVLTQSLLRGRAAGLMVVLGLCTGLLVHTAAVVLGVAALFQTSVAAFTVLKLVGVAYLLYLGWQAFRAASLQGGRPRGEVLSWGQLYRRGILMNVANPKVSLFFLAFLPQFADPARGSLSGQLIMLGLLFILATILVFGTIALLAGAVGQWLNRSPNGQRFMNRLAGTVFVALAVGLASAGQG